MDREAVRTADTALGISDPVAAVAALNAQTTTFTVKVATADMRAVLWPTLEYSELRLLSESRDFAVVPRNLVKLAIGAISLLDSGRDVQADDAAGWAAVMGGLAQFPVVSAASVSAVGALRTETSPNWRVLWDSNLPLSVEDLQSIRGD